nr:hypothetical protein [Tanacetum cinerariifolium]
MDKEYQPFPLDGLEEEDMELDVDVDEDVYKDLLLHPELSSLWAHVWDVMSKPTDGRSFPWQGSGDVLNRDVAVRVMVRDVNRVVGF